MAALIALADPLLYARAIHFAATMLVAGVVLFAVFVAGPAWRGMASNGAVAIKVRTRLAVIAWIGLALAAISGATWLVLTAAAMSDQAAAKIFGDGVLMDRAVANDFRTRLAGPFRRGLRTGRDVAGVTVAAKS